MTAKRSTGSKKSQTKTPMKRISGTERKQQLLGNAALLFAFKGFHGVTTKEIAKSAGVSEPILYQHYRSKEEIYEALDTLCSGQTAGFTKLLEETGATTEGLVKATYLLIRLISFSKEAGDKPNPDAAQPAELLLRLMGQSFLEDGRFARVLVDECIGAFFEEWLACYKAAEKTNDLNTGVTPEAHALWKLYEFIVGSGFFVLPSKKLIDKEKSEEEGVRSATLFALRGLGVKESAIKKQCDWMSLKQLWKNFGSMSAPPA